MAEAEPNLSASARGGRCFVSVLVVIGHGTVDARVRVQRHRVSQRNVPRSARVVLREMPDWSVLPGIRGVARRQGREGVVESTLE